MTKNTVPKDEAFMQESEILEDGLKYKKLEISLLITLVFLILILIFCLLNWFPFNYKINGKWSNELDTSQTIINDNGYTILTMDNLQGNEGMALKFEGETQKYGTNRFIVEKPVVSLVLEKKNISDDEINSLKEKTQLYEVKNETKDQIVLNYTEKSLKEAFGTENLRDLLYYEVKVNKFGKSYEIKLRNNKFSKGTLTFIKNE